MELKELQRLRARWSFIKDPNDLVSCRYGNAVASMSAGKLFALWPCEIESKEGGF